MIFLVALLQLTFALEMRGTAYTLDGSQRLYEEVHKITLNDKGLNQKIVTEYYKPNGELFAKMISDFSKSETLPIIVFEDYRFQKKETMEPQNNEWVFKKVLGSKSEQERKFTPRENMVAGQGFDNFVKLKFDDLAKDKVPLQFGILSEMDFYSFKGYKKESLGDKILRFGIKIDNIFLRLFVDELMVEYDAQTKRLLTYKGLSNLPADDGSSQSVLIKYKTVAP